MKQKKIYEKFKNSFLKDESREKMIINVYKQTHVHTHKYLT